MRRAHTECPICKTHLSCIGKLVGTAVTGDLEQRHWVFTWIHPFLNYSSLQTRVLIQNKDARILTSLRISIIKIRRSWEWDRLTFIMGIPIPVRHLYIEAAPRVLLEMLFISLQQATVRPQYYIDTNQSKTIRDAHKTTHNTPPWKNTHMII